MADQTQPQGPTPVFMSRRHDWDDVVEHSEEPQPMPVTTPVTPSSRYTASSFGSIPEFPAPVSEPAQPATAVPRRSSVSGPPSSRRGASSHYSTASNVSPIPEESSRSHESYASSSAMPGHWSPSSFRTISPAHGEPTYGDSPTEQGRESVAEDYGDESKLVRSASIGKKGRAALVHNRPGPSASAQAKPPPNPVPAIHGPFQSGTGYVEEGSGSSSNTAATVKRAKTEDDTSEQGKQYLVPLGLQDSTVPESEVPPVPPLRHSSSRLSTMKRPPRLDMEAVRSAEARGSMTSLPDLIKRATRLAAMIDTGKRPASRFDNLEDFLDKPALRERGKEAYCKLTASPTTQMAQANVAYTTAGRHPSGFSDMLAAFPSPAQVTPRDQKPRGSWFPKTTSWPLAPSRLRAAGEDESEDRDIDEKLASGEGQPKRRCCGMPPWLCVLVILLILAVIVVAVVIPLQYFVLKNLGDHSVAPTASETCQDTLKCRNGGTNIVSQGTCSCICTNGFTGRDCGTAGSEGCSTTNLISSNSSPDITNVTVGSAIPRLIVDAQANFSIPLSGMEILAQINRGNLSCRAQNSLVTFEGRSMRTGQEGSDVSEMMDSAVAVATNDYSSPVPHTEKELDSNFTVTEDVLDFARVAVLYVLQSDGYNDASSAQTSIGSFFSRVDSDGGRVTNRQAQNITMDSDNTVDLVDLRVDLGNGVVGGS